MKHSALYHDARHFPRVARRRLLFVAAAAMLLIESPAAAQPVAAAAEAKTFRDLPYVADGHERQRLDLYFPAEGADWPLVVWVHGGAWRAGSKDHFPAAPLLDRGFAVASVNYRLSQHANFPAQIEDCKAAVRWLRAHAEEYGYHAERIAAWGSSAGGHLVALLGTTGDVEEFDVGEHLDQSSRVQAVVDFFGPTDFLQMNALAGDLGRMDHDAADSPESLLIGGAIQDHRDLVARANPIAYVTDDDATFLICHGEADPLVAVGQSKLLHAALAAAEVPSTLITVPETGHDHAALWRRHGDQVLEFLERQLR